ncbi:gas vesicle protein GvpO [Nonomuraea jiangxiensis]|uniref:Gas vesicle synthesis protein GvpO n=1 Tax=Nonomuraea jiangxiensis TaxID=633440 RepID=A0A1G8FLH4_9ACTN|nr:gas vesicle protein GvpO [Nonomuraea jiangxiensis]SDH82985.1 Gas vesicle synthesis protein GvpO [Nonomuraea jiangxiensis]
MPVKRHVVPERRPRSDVDQPRPRDDRPYDDRPRGEERSRGEERLRGEERSRGEERLRGEERPRSEPRSEPRGELRGEERSRLERTRPAGLDAATAGESGIRHIDELTSKAIEGVTSVEPAEDGWVVDVEVVEDRRVPSSGDILAIYEVQLARDGSLRSYRRVRRYRRANTDLGQA